MNYISNEEMQKLLPQMVKNDFEQPLDAFVESLRSDIANPYLNRDLKVPLATGENATNYLRAIGRENSYTRLAREIHCSPSRPVTPGAGMEPRGPRGIDLVEHAHKMARDMYIRSRLNEFEAVREVIYNGIEKMFADPMVIADKKFGYLVSLVEQTRSASVEMHLHFGNAFVEAWDQIPSMVLELAIKPGESIKVSRDDKETELRRQRSHGMSI